MKSGCVFRQSNQKMALRIIFWTQLAHVNEIHCWRLFNTNATGMFLSLWNCINRATLLSWWQKKTCTFLPKINKRAKKTVMNSVFCSLIYMERHRKPGVGYLHKNILTHTGKQCSEFKLQVVLINTCFSQLSSQSSKMGPNRREDVKQSQKQQGIAAERRQLLSLR